ncbi:MAG: primosomal protein N' [Oscillospiraceae bacterium]|nr:primosomal protein N' [Oscillospiraceae bacterium]
MIAKIAVSAAKFFIDKPYSYRFGPELSLVPGLRVMVPFGPGNRRSEGIVLAVEQGEEAGLKSVLMALDQEPVLDETMLRLGAFIRERYFCTFYEAIRVMLPAGLWFREVERFSLLPEAPWEGNSGCDEDMEAICASLRDLGGEAEEAMLAKAVPDEARRENALKALLKKKWIKRESDFLRRTGDKSELIATLAASAEEAMEYAARRPKSAAMQKAVLELMCAIGSGAVKEICYYTGASTATIKRLVNLGYLSLSQREVLRCREIEPAKLDGPLTLSDEQREVYEGLCRRMDGQKPGGALLYGVTGSGKTSVYLKLIARCLEQGKSAMLLVPEIALTAQLLGLLAAHFGDRVAVLHSSLSAGERYDQWKRLKSGEARVAVGTRSAVFAPCEKLGLIILDEEQEHSYKSETSPRYSARDIAFWRGARENALVLLGSATPSVETMYRAKSGAIGLYELRKRYNGKALPRVEILDLREEIRNGNDSPFSEFLLDSIRDNLAHEKQTILFLNRRGASRAMVCIDCRESPECPRCTNRLTYHSANGRLMCHYCGHSQPVTDRCPSCGGPMKALGVGTQRIQEILEFEFPDTPVLRMDADTVTAVNTHERILNRFREEKIPVLIGTQMVAKGLNLPDVTLVGVLDADMSLYGGGYRAAETTFNMLTQVVGRAGRGESEGRAVIQTMSPEHQIICLGAKQDYDSFYDLEIGMRRVTQSPPFSDHVTITFVGENEAGVLRGAQLFRDSLLAWLQSSGRTEEDWTLLGPAPCPVMKINYNFRYRLTLRCLADMVLRRTLAALLRQFLADKHNRGVSAFVDINGYE